VRDRRYSSSGWKQLRLLVLERDGWRCQLMLPGCKGIANHVDHKIEPSKGGRFYDVTNCRAACSACNIHKRNKGIAEDAKRWRQNEQGVPTEINQRTP
jgi:5-methylcytosine-specific restriction endonuclease McrA